MVTLQAIHAVHRRRDLLLITYNSCRRFMQQNWPLPDVERASILLMHSKK